MRSLEEILRSYNIVNSRAASRYTVRFAAVLLLTGVFIVAGFMLLTGGPDRSLRPGDHTAARDGGTDDDDTGPGGAYPVDPFTIVTRDEGDWTYLGYPQEAYDPGQRDRYDPAELARAFLEWQAAHPEAAALASTEPAYDLQGHGMLLGYRIHTDRTS